MKSTLLTFIIAMFAASCAAAWTPSAEEIALSAREDAREAALFSLIGTPSAEEIALSAREDAREAALFSLIGK